MSVITSSPENILTDLNQILEPIQEDMRVLNQVIGKRLASEVTLINQISQYLVQAGGKRIRPAILFLVANALNDGKTVPFSHDMAAVVEFIHTATLLHDDVVDESDLRRGRKTANAVFGNAASVLVGDFLYSRAFQMMVEPAEMVIMKILSSATNIIAEGEVLQLLNLNDPEVDEQRYRQVILYKTAKLFEASAELGAVLAKASAPLTRASAQFGNHIGVTFQLVDDWLDYSADAFAMGKNTGDDLREGKPTLPLIYLLNHGSAKEKALAQQAIQQVDTCDEAFFEEVLRTVRSSGALEYTLEQAMLEAEKARSCLASFPKNAYTEALQKLCDYSLARSS